MIRRTLLLCFLIAVAYKSHSQIQINFTGKIDFGQMTKEQINTPADSVTLFENTKDILKSPNVITFSTIGTILGNEEEYKKRIHLNRGSISAPTDYAMILKQNGITCLNAANSNIGTIGFEGLASTTEALKKYNIAFAGIRSFCESTIITHKGTKIGYASFGNAPYSPSINDTIKISQVINSLKKECEIIVISYSIDKNGLIYTTYESKNQPHIKLAEKFAKYCIDAGADIIYGDVGNTPQHVELYQERIIIYSLGNFCSPSQKRYTKESGCAPILSVNTHPDGTFINATIHSFIQTNSNGPHVDKENKSVQIITEKTKKIKPDTKIMISSEGIITPTYKSNTTLALEVINESKKHTGKPYRRGASGPNIFDCSGFTSFIFKKIGINLLRTSQSQYTQGKKIDMDELKPGDLVFFSGSATRRIGHVGIVVSTDIKNKTFKFIHASNHGVVIDNFATSSYYIRRYIGAKRVIGVLQNDSIQ